MRGGFVAEADGVDVVVVVGEADGRLSAFEVVDDDAVVGCACDDFAAVAAEAEGPDAEAVAAHVAVGLAGVGARRARGEVGEVEEGVVGLVGWVGGCKADHVANTAVCEEAVVG